MLVSNEVAPLRRAAVFRPGLEMLCMQTLPSEESLIPGEMNVPAAHSEIVDLADAMTEQGVKVFDLRAAYAGTLSSSQQTLSPDEFARRIVQSYEIPEEVTADYVNRETLALGDQQKALKLLDALCFPETGKPLGNLLYPRDPAVIIEGDALVSSMNSATRVPEPQFAQRYIDFFVSDGELIGADTGTIEGGDVVYFNNSLYIGVGPRTTREAAESVARHMMEKYHMETYFVQLGIHDEWRLNMEQMHLDCVFMPVDYDKVATSLELVGTRGVTSYIGGYTEPLAQHLHRKGYRAIDFTADEQAGLALNVLPVRPGFVIGAVNGPVQEKYEKAGVQFTYVSMPEVIKGAGGPHCAVFSLVRQ